MTSRLVIAAALLAAGVGSPALAKASIADRAAAQRKVNAVVAVLVAQGAATPAQQANIRDRIAANTGALDAIADVLDSEGVDINAPLAGSEGQALLTAVIGKLGDRRGAIDALIGTATDARSRQKGIADALAGATNPARTGATDFTNADTSKTDRGPQDRSAGAMVGDAATTEASETVAWRKANNQDPLTGEQKGPKVSAGDAAKAYYENMSKQAEKAGPDREKRQAERAAEAKAKEDAVRKENCVSGMQAGCAGVKTPLPEGEGRTRPTTLDPAQVAGALGGKQGQVTNPAPDSDQGGMSSGGRSGPLPTASIGGGVSNPGAAAGTKVDVTPAQAAKTLPKKPGDLDPERNGDAPKPSAGGTPSTPNPGQPPK